MAIVRMAPGNDYAICPVGKGFKEEHEVYAAGTGKAYNLHRRRIFYTACAGEIGTGIGAPVTDECNYFWLKI